MKNNELLNLPFFKVMAAQYGMNLKKFSGQKQEVCFETYQEKAEQMNRILYEFVDLENKKE